MRLLDAACAALIVSVAPAYAAGNAEPPAEANVSISVAGNEGAASRSAGATYQLRATVPLACWVREENTVTAGALERGAVIEACNNPAGFEVSAHYRPLDSGESAHVLYDGRLVDLPDNGQATLRRTFEPQIRRMEYEVETARLDAPLVLAFSITPL